MGRGVNGSMSFRIINVQTLNIQKKKQLIHFTLHIVPRMSDVIASRSMPVKGSCAHSPDSTAQRPCSTRPGTVAIHRCWEKPAGVTWKF